MMDRRAALARIATLGITPFVLQACGKKNVAATSLGKVDVSAVPRARPEGWDPVVFNRRRGAAGAIPPAYMGKINAPDGISKHLGKHLPYVVSVAGVGTSEGTLALMWGDTRKGWVRHPNAPKSVQKPGGHWYNWVRLRNNRTGQEVTTRFDDWPRCTSKVKGRVVGQRGDDPAADGGRNSVYVVQLPEGTRAGDELRVWGHCLSHGEYVDFLSA